jgi:hypothetical protein
LYRQARVKEAGRHALPQLRARRGGHRAVAAARQHVRRSRVRAGALQQRGTAGAIGADQRAGQARAAQQGNTAPLDIALFLPGAQRVHHNMHYSRLTGILPASSAHLNTEPSHAGPRDVNVTKEEAGWVRLSLQRGDKLDTIEKARYEDSTIHCLPPSHGPSPVPL